MNLRDRLVIPELILTEKVKSLVRSSRTLLKSEGGAAAIYFVLTAPILIGGLGFGVEVGSWYYYQQNLQSMADVLADSLAGRIGTGATQAELERVANHTLETSRFEFARGTATFVVSPEITSNIPSFVDGTTVEVRLTRNTPRLFSGFFTPGQFEVSARAAARVTKATPGCILALSRADGNALQLFNSATVRLTGCEALSNSSHEQGFVVPLGSRLTADCARTAGLFLTPGQLSVTCRNGIQQEAGTTVNPYAGLQEPNFGAYSCDYMTRVVVYPGAPVPNARQTGPDGRPVRVFCGGLDIEEDATLPNGLYLIGASLSIGPGTVTGEEVTIYIRPGASLVTDQTRTILRLSAPTTGNYAGMLFMGGRTVSAATIFLQLGLNSRLDGAVYFPGSLLNFRATGNIAGCTQLIGRTVRLLGSWNLASDWQNPGACPSQRPIVASRNVNLIE